MKLHLNLALRKALLAAMFAVGSITYTLATANAAVDQNYSFPYVDESVDLKVYSLEEEDYIWEDKYANGATLTFNGDAPDTASFSVSSSVDIAVYAGAQVADGVEMHTTINFISGDFGSPGYSKSSQVYSALLFGGSESGYFVGSSTLVWLSGDIGNYHGGSASGTFEGDTIIELYGEDDFFNVIYGGNASGIFEGTTNITLESGMVEYIYGGSEGGSFYGSTLINIYNINTIAELVAGGSTSGNFEGDTVINLEGDAQDWNGCICFVYGGNISGTFSGTTTINMNGGKVYYGTDSDIFGGNADGVFIGDSKITFTQGITDTIYGGSENGSFTGTSTIVLDVADDLDTDSVDIDYVYGGSKEGSFIGDSSITILQFNADYSALYVYGGNKEGDFEGTSYIYVENAELERIGGGNGIVTGSTDYISSFTGSTEIVVNNVIVDNIIGGSLGGDFTGSTKITFENSTCEGLYGGSYVIYSKYDDAVIEQTSIEIYLISGEIDYICAAGQPSSGDDVFSTESTYIEISDQVVVNDWIDGDYDRSTDRASVGTRTINFNTENSDYELLNGVLLLDFDVINVASGSVVTTEYDIDNKYASSNSITKTGEGTWRINIEEGLLGTSQDDITSLIIAEGYVELLKCINVSMTVQSGACLSLLESSYTNWSTTYYNEIQNGIVVCLEDGAILRMNYGLNGIDHTEGSSGYGYITFASTDTKIVLDLQGLPEGDMTQGLFTSVKATSDSTNMSLTLPDTGIELQYIDGSGYVCKASDYISSIVGMSDEDFDNVWMIVESDSLLSSSTSVYYVDLLLTNTLTFADIDLVWKGGNGTWTQADAWLDTDGEATTYNSNYYGEYNVHFSQGTGSIQLESEITVNSITVEKGLSYQFYGEDLNITQSLVLAEGATLELSNNTTIEGTLDAAQASIVNSGDLSIESGGSLLSLRSSEGTVTLQSDASVSIDQIDCQELVVQQGATLTLGTNSTQETMHFYTLHNEGQIISFAAVEIHALTEKGGSIQAPTLTVQAGSTFTDLSVSTLVIEGDLSTTSSMLSVSSITNCVLDITNFDNSLDIGSYTIMDGCDSLTWDSFTLSDAMNATVESFIDADKEITWLETGDSLQLVVSAIVQPSDSLTWLGGNGSVTSPALWDDSMDNWGGYQVPDAQTDALFILSGDSYIQVSGEKEVAAVSVSSEGVSLYTLTMSGDSLAAESVSITSANLQLASEWNIAGSVTLQEASLLISAQGVLMADSLDLDAPSRLENQGTLSLQAGLQAESADLENSGSVLLGASSSLQSISSTGTLTLTEGASLSLNGTQEGLLSTIATLQNAGAITSSHALSLTELTLTGGTISAPELTVQAGSTFTDLAVDSLVIEGSLSANSSMITVSTIATASDSLTQITLDLVDLGDNLAAGSYTIIEGTALSWDDFVLSDSLVASLDALSSSYKEWSCLDTATGLELVIISVIPDPESLSWVGGYGTAASPIVWDDSADNWTGTPLGWEGSFVPGDDTDVSFDLAEDCYVALQGTKIVEDLILSYTGGASSAQLSLSGDSLQAESLSSTSIDVSISNSLSIEQAVSLTGAQMTLTDSASLFASSMQLDAASALVNAGEVQITGALTATQGASIENTGSLSVGDGSALGDVSGAGSLTVFAQATASAGVLSQESLSIQAGASLSLSAADATSQTVLGQVDNQGSLSADHAISLTESTQEGGAISATSLSIISNSSFSSIETDALNITGALTMSEALLSVDSVTQYTDSLTGITLDLSGFNSSLAAGSYTIIEGAEGLSWDDFILSDAMNATIASYTEMDQVVQWTEEDGNLQLVIIAASPRYWTTSTDYSVMLDEEGSVIEGSEKSLFVNRESGEITSYTEFAKLTSIYIDADTLIDLSVSLTPTEGQSLILNELSGAAGKTLSLKGSDADTHTVTLRNTSSTQVESDIIAEGLTLQVENTGDVVLSLASLDLQAATLQVLSDAQVSLAALTGDAMSKVVNDGSIILQDGLSCSLDFTGEGSLEVARQAAVTLGSVSSGNIVICEEGVLTLEGNSSLIALDNQGVLKALGSLSLEASLENAGSLQVDTLLVYADNTIEELELLSSASIETNVSLDVGTLTATAASIENQGSLRLGDASYIQLVEGTGSIIAAAQASITIEQMDSTALSLEEGSTVTLLSDTLLLDLDNLGTLRIENNTLTLGASQQVMSLSSDITVSSSMGSIIAQTLIVNDARILGDVTIGESLIVNYAGGLQVNSLSSDNTEALVTGKVEILGTGGVYLGGFSDAELSLNGEELTQSLQSSEEVTLSGSAGSFVLSSQGEDNALQSIQSTGVNLDLTDLGSSTLELMEASSLCDASISLSWDVANFVATGEAQTIFSGADLTLSNASIEISVLDDSTLTQLKQLTDTDQIVILELGDNVISDESLSCLVVGESLQKYISSADFNEAGQLIVNINTTFYEDAIVSGNGAAGMQLISSVYQQVNPQDSPDKYEDLASAMDAIDNMLIAENHAGVNKLAAAIAGASTTALGSSLMSEIERQVRSNRNRAAASSLNKVADSNFSTWMAAESNFDELGNDGNALGHSYSSFGGSIGVDMELSKNASIGLSYTMMYGDVSTSDLDRGEGDLDTQFMSLYSQINSGNWGHSLSMSFGWGSAEMERSVCHSEGSYRSRGEGDTQAFGLAYEAAYKVHKDWSVLAGAALYHSSIDGYNETGSDAGLSVGKQSSTWANFGVGVNFAAQLGEAVVNRSCSLNTRAMLKFYAGDVSSTSDVSLLAGGVSSTVQGTEAGRCAIEFATGLLIPIAEQGGDIFIDASVQLRDEQSSVQVTTGYKFQF